MKKRTWPILGASILIVSVGVGVWAYKSDAFSREPLINKMYAVDVEKEYAGTMAIKYHVLKQYIGRFDNTKVTYDAKVIEITSEENKTSVIADIDTLFGSGQLVHVTYRANTEAVQGNWIRICGLLDSGFAHKEEDNVIPNIDADLVKVIDSPQLD